MALALIGSHSTVTTVPPPIHACWTKVTFESVSNGHSALHGLLITFPSASAKVETKTSRSGVLISRKTNFPQFSLPSAMRMQHWKAPPTRRSSVQIGSVTPLGPNH